MQAIVDSLPLERMDDHGNHAAHRAPERPGDHQELTMSSPSLHNRAVKEQKVVIITGASQGIGAGLVAAYRRQGWVVVASPRTIKPSKDQDVLAVEGDIPEPLLWQSRPARFTIEEIH